VLLHKLLALVTLPVFIIKRVTTAISGSTDKDEERKGALKGYRREKRSWKTQREMVRSSGQGW
jgi:hypothetical protein